MRDRLLPARSPSFTFDPLFHAGAYYVQEASSTFLEQAIRSHVKTPVRCLDLCAAPAGKSTHLAACLPEGSLLVSDEAIRSRSHILAENIAKRCRTAAAGVVGEDGFVLFRGQPEREEGCKLALRRPERVIRAEQDARGAVTADDLDGGFTRQVGQGGRAVHRDVFNVAELAACLLPHRVAAHVRGNQLQPGVDAQDRDEAVRVGVVIAAVAGVHEDGQPVRLAHFVDSEAAEVVNLEALDVGVQLDAVQTQLSQMAVVADKIRTVGIERASPKKRPPAAATSAAMNSLMSRT